MSLALLKGKIYPDLTFSIGFVPRSKKALEEKRYDREYESQFDSYLEIERDYRGSKFEEIKFFAGSEIPPRFIKSPQSSQIKKTYGKNGITKYGRKNVSCISTLLQQHYGKEQLGFATATLPPLTKEGSFTACAHWGEIVRRFFQEIKRYYSLIGQEFLYVSCTEIQEKRFERTKVAYPHLHFVYVARKNNRSNWYISAKTLRIMWRRVTVKVLKKESFEKPLSDSTFNASIDCQVVKKSASSYLGKYLSKGCQVVASMQKEGYEFFPRQWWSASMQCKKMFRESIINIDSSLCRDIFYGLGDYLEDGFVTWFRFVEIPIGGESRVVGVVGTVSSGAYFLMKEYGAL